MNHSRLILLIVRVNKLLVKGKTLTMLDVSKLFKDFSVELDELNGSLNRPTLFKFYLTLLIKYFKRINNDPFKLPLMLDIPDRLPLPWELTNIPRWQWLLIRLLIKLILLLISKLLKE